jgi:hypothetical protein
MQPTIRVTQCEGHQRLSLTDRDGWRFRQILESFKDFVPEDLRYFDVEERQWSIEPDGYGYLARWLRHMREQFGARVIIDPGPEPRARKAPERPARVDPYEILFLREGAPIQLVQSARRVLASIHHPDKGGDVEIMKMVNQAADAIEQQLERSAAA